MSEFWDKVSDTLNGAATTVTDKAKEVSEVTALKGQVRSQKKKLENAYLEIGGKYYEAHKDDENDIYAEQLRVITDAKKEIEKLEEDIATIKAK